MIGAIVIALSAIMAGVMFYLSHAFKKPPTPIITAATLIERQKQIDAKTRETEREVLKRETEGAIANKPATEDTARAELAKLRAERLELEGKK